MTNRVTLKTVFGAVLKKESFNCNDTLYGYVGKAYYSFWPGQLPKEFKAELEAAKEAADFYVVVSYTTPIAWFANGKWRVPDKKYSHITSRHLSAIRVFDGKIGI